MACRRVVEREQKLIQLEKAINPLLDENDRVGFSFILAEVVQKCKNIPKSAPFHNKVDPRKVSRSFYPNYSIHSSLSYYRCGNVKVQGYYEQISRPMDLSQIERNVKEHQYTTVSAFYRDVEQVWIGQGLVQPDYQDFSSVIEVVMKCKEFK